MEHVGKAPEEGGEDPAGGDDEEPLAVAQKDLVPSGSSREIEDEARAGRDQNGEDETTGIGLPVIERAGKGCQHREAEDEQEGPEGVDNGFNLHPKYSN